MSEGRGFPAFRERVLAEPAWQEALLAVVDGEAFAQAVADLARAHGYALTPEDLVAAMREGQHAWLCFWMPVI